MSTRNIRKMLEKSGLTSLDALPDTEDADENFEPNYMAKQASAYEGLVISGGEDSSIEDEKKISSNDTSDEAVAIVAGNSKKKNKNNRKKRNRNRRSQAHPSENDEDEVAKVVAEVNELLGEPEVQEPEPQQDPMADSIALFKVDQKYLNAHKELTRMFGPDEDERKSRRTSLRQLRRRIILPRDTYNFTAKGLGMKLIETKGDVKYFKFEHGLEYQKNMQILVDVMKLIYIDEQASDDNDVFPSGTVEALIQDIDTYFYIDESSIAINAIEQALHFMQCVLHPDFNYVDGNTRLDYIHIENRAFHIILLKYLYILTNKACHRTALEIAKLMLKLDPSDPLGVFFIIDTLALRAREHQWLVDAYARWAVEKDAGRLFNYQYSHAVARYHLYLKNKRPEDLQMANKLIKEALVKFPEVSKMIRTLVKQRSEEVQNLMFTSRDTTSNPDDILMLQLLYAKLIWHKWREPNILEWMQTNEAELLAQYPANPELQQIATHAAQERSHLFRRFPLEIRRHISIISSMSKLLIDDELGLLVGKTPSCNPFPTLGRVIDEHRYYKEWDTDFSIPQAYQGLLRSFFNSLVPDSTPNNVPNNRGG